jgi:hypothetical protein
MSAIIHLCVTLTRSEPHPKKNGYWYAMSSIACQTQGGAEGALIPVKIQGYKLTGDPPLPGSLLISCGQFAAVEEHGEAVIYMNDIRSTELDRLGVPLLPSVG